MTLLLFHFPSHLLRLDFIKKDMSSGMSQRVDKPSHSLSVLRAGAHECQIRSAPVLVLPRLQRFSITLKRRQRAKIKIILSLCQQSETCHPACLFLFISDYQSFQGTYHDSSYGTPPFLHTSYQVFRSSYTGQSKYHLLV